MMQNRDRKPDMINKDEFLKIYDLIKDLAKKQDLTIAALSISRSASEKRKKAREHPDPLNIDKGHQKGPAKN